MTDLARLYEALDAWGAASFGAFSSDDAKVLADAARAYRDLLANGQRVEWCEEHDFQIKPGANVCLASPFGSKGCRRIVSRLLVDYPKEAEK